LILCDELIVQQAQNFNKPILAHYAHLIVHGMLHLQGMDHLTCADAQIMEQHEIEILNYFGIDNPYIYSKP